MTILQAIAAADRLRPNDVPAAVKLHWLSALDGQLSIELLGEPFEPYGAETDAAQTALLVPTPYDLFYVDYLCMRIDLALDDLARYENDAALFENGLGRWRRSYGRTHLAGQTAQLRF